MDVSDFPSEGVLRVYASIVELEGQVVEDKGPLQFRLRIGNKDIGKPEKAARFATASEPLDLVLIVESSALYGPPKVVAPPPAPRVPVDKKKKGAKAPAAPPAIPKGGKAGVAKAAPHAGGGDEPLTHVKSAVRSLLESLSPRVRVFLIDYGGSVTPHPPFRPAQAAVGEVDDLTPDEESGDLRLVDAVNAALVELQRAHANNPSPPRRLIVVVSDGLNSLMDRKTFRALGDAAAKKHVPIHTIAFSPTDERGPLLNLGEISKRSNGTFRWARSADDLHNQIETLTDELNKQYVLTFKPDLSSLEGKTFQLFCDDMSSNVYDPKGIAQTHATRRWPWWVWVLGGVLIVTIALFILWLRNREPAPPRMARPRMTQPRPQVQRHAQPVAAPPPQARTQRGLIIVVSGHRAGERISVGAEPVTIGKGPSTLQILDDPTVSTRHAQIAGGVLTDLGSTNGTFVNNQRVTQPVVLQDGDLVRFGNTQIKFRVE